MPVFSPIPHDQFLADVLAIAAAIQAAPEWQPDFIIGVGRGGLVPAVYLSHATGRSMLSVDHSSQMTDFADAPLVRLAARTRGGEKLLFVDDINDSGLTIARLRAALGDAGAAAGHVRFATLLDNIVSSQRVDYFARRIDRTVTKDWFVFPWESVAPAASIAADAAQVPERTE